MTKKRLFCILAAVLFGLSAVWAIIDTPILYATIYADISSIQPKDGLKWHDWIYMFVFLSLAVLFIMQAVKDKIPSWAFIIPLSLVIIFRFYSLFAAIDNYIEVIEMLKRYTSSSLANKEMLHYYADICLQITISVIGIVAVILLLLTLLLKKRMQKVFFIPAVLPILCVLLQIFGYCLDFAISGSVTWKDVGMMMLLVCFYSFSFGLQAVSYFFFGMALVKEWETPCIAEDSCLEASVEEVVEIPMESPVQAETEMAETVPQEFAIGVADELKKYKELLDIGAISQEEYELAKQRLLKM